MIDIITKVRKMDKNIKITDFPNFGKKSTFFIIIKKKF